MVPKPGDAIPDVTLYKDTPGGAVKLRELLAGKKAILFAVPGAFTPGCSKTHLPSYVANHGKLKEVGADVIVCVSVNDPFVMAAWGEAQGVGDKILMLADTQMELTNALDVVLDAEAFLGNKRSQRYALLAEDNVIKAFNLEESPGEIACSLADPMIELLKSL